MLWGLVTLGCPVISARCPLVSAYGTQPGPCNYGTNLPVLNFCCKLFSTPYFKAKHFQDWKLKNNFFRASLVVQWLRLLCFQCRVVLGVQVQSLVRELDPECLEAWSKKFFLIEKPNFLAQIISLYNCLCGDDSWWLFYSALDLFRLFAPTLHWSGDVAWNCFLTLHTISMSYSFLSVLQI